VFVKGVPVKVNVLPLSALVGEKLTAAAESVASLAGIVKPKKLFPHKHT
jgi:hypothetical protein